MPRTKQGRIPKIIPKKTLESQRIPRKCSPVQTGIKRPKKFAEVKGRLFRKNSIKIIRNHSKTKLIYKQYGVPLLKGLGKAPCRPSVCLPLCRLIRKTIADLDCFKQRYYANILNQINKFQQCVVNQSKVYQDKIVGLRTLIPQNDVIQAAFSPIIRTCQAIKDQRLQNLATATIVVFLQHMSRMRIVLKDLSSQFGQGQPIIGQMRQKVLVQFNAIGFQCLKLDQFLSSIRQDLFREFEVYLTHDATKESDSEYSQSSEESDSLMNQRIKNLMKPPK